MGLLDKIKEAAANAAEEREREEKQTKQDLNALTEYVHDHIQEFHEVFVENEGKTYPVKSSLIFGESRSESEIRSVIYELKQEEEKLSLKEQFLGRDGDEPPYYIETQIGKLYVSEAPGTVNFEPAFSSDFRLEKKQRAIKAILDGIDSSANLSSAEVMEKIKYCNSQRIKEEDRRLQEAWDKCVTSLIKFMPEPKADEFMNEIRLCYTELNKDSDEMVSDAWGERAIALISSMPDPNASELMKEIKLCYSELRKDIDYGIAEKWEERAHHLMAMLEIPSAADAIRTIQEYELLQKQLASDNNMRNNYKFAEEWKKKKMEVTEYAKLYYMDEPSVRQYFLPWWKRIFRFGK